MRVTLDHDIVLPGQIEISKGAKLDVLGRVFFPTFNGEWKRGLIVLYRGVKFVVMQHEVTEI